MNTITDMLAALRAHPDVLGLAEYGSARHQDESIAGDYDLVAVLREAEPSVESLHFSVGGVPVDLNLRSVAGIDAMPCAGGFDAILLDARVIHDPTGEVAAALNRLRDRHPRAASDASPPDLAGMRHGARHILDKVRDRWDTHPALCRYLLHQGVFWFVPQYFEVRGLPFRGEKHAFAYLEEHEPGLFATLSRFFASSDDAEKARLYEIIGDAVLDPVGGMWNPDEVLTYGDQAQGAQVFDRLFPQARKRTAS